MAKTKKIKTLGKKDINSYGYRKNKIQKNVLNEIPMNWTTGATKYCRVCNQGELYTARIRMRIGKKVLVNTGNYNNEKYKTKQQLQIIVGQVCTTCGAFEEDPDFKAARIKNLKLKIEHGWNKEVHKKLLKEAEKD